MKAYRHDFDVIATLILGADSAGVSDMPVGAITTDTMRTAFAHYAKTHEPASKTGRSPRLVLQSRQPRSTASSCL